VIDGDVVERIDGCKAQRASALTRVYVPGRFHVLDTLAAEAGNHAETLPSDHENRYSTESPALETEPPVVYVYAAPTDPLVGPLGAEGADTVS